MDRRTVIQLLSTAAIGGIAGCSTGDGGGEEPSSSPTDSLTTTPTETPPTAETETTMADDTTANDGIVTVSAEDSVEATVDRIKSDIENSPLNLMTTVDHAANADSVDEELPPTTLLLFGNPAVGTPLMQAARSVAIDLPQKMLVFEDAGQTTVAYNDPEYLAQRHGIEGQSDRLEQISSVLDQLATGTS
jgi:uncharacterized protein (DUF302 family)